MSFQNHIENHFESVLNQYSLLKISSLKKYKQFWNGFTELNDLYGIHTLRLCLPSILF